MLSCPVLSCAVPLVHGDRRSRPKRFSSTSGVSLTVSAPPVNRVGHDMRALTVSGCAVRLAVVVGGDGTRHRLRLSGRRYSGGGMSLGPTRLTIAVGEQPRQLTLEGDLDSHTAPNLETAIQALGYGSGITIDLAHVDFIDSSARRARGTMTRSAMS